MMALADLLTVIIPVYNEEKNLPLCLEPIKDLKHIVIVDSGSSDKTKEVALRYGCKVMDFRWDGKSPKKRTWAMRNCDVQTPWVMFLDADERFTDAFRKELEEILPNTIHDKFWYTLDNWFMGRMLKHGDPMRKDSLLRYGAGEYEQIDENGWSKLPIEVHEHIQIKGSAGEIKARLEHHDQRTLSNYYAKHCDYADFEARRFSAISNWSILTRREKIKYRLMRWKLFPFAYWFVSYILKGGFLDGAPGFYFALNKMSYFYQMQAKIWFSEYNSKR